MNPTRLYLIRHGETEFSGDDIFGGSKDVDLNGEGRRQINCLARRLSNENIAAIYCSALRRAIETASILAEPLKLTPQIRMGLREIHHGHWEPMKEVEVMRCFPEEYAAWQEDPFTFAPEDGETGLEVLTNALPVIREIVTNHSGQTVAVISHEATLKLILSSVLGIDLRVFRDRLALSPGSLNIVEFYNPVTTRLVLFNDISHYSERPPIVQKLFAN